MLFRSPFAKGRILDLSLAGAQVLGMTGAGTDQIELQVVGFTGRPDGIGVLRIQVGSFAERQNAQLLLDQIQPDYPGGRIAQIDLAEGRRYRVHIGQFPTESAAQSAAARLDRKYNLQSYVVRDDG